MAWPYNQRREDSRIYGSNLDDPAQTFHALASDLATSTEFEGSMPNDVPVSYFSPWPRVNPPTVQGGSTGAMSSSVRHQPNASRIAAYQNPPQELPISRGRNSTRRRARSHQISGPDDREFECKWENCGYRGTFNRESSLLRHIRNLHIRPLAHICPVQGCERAFNRADNLAQHIRNNHYTY
ncbi:unnamed protein product [Penicillium glandicola]